ncbi:hypothetical protein GORBP_077_00320 [Gordonia rubripertincta NBRC 101908]|uniref:UDP-glucose 4-epimerase n=1 Tax=Gordonia rubripertincta NBRC 101908 TaxID=1077975 RepID=A0ABQ0HWF0_GORRU|nr:hypothetical protein GORBP_077_00320 [Gordonia rubripertincta NBRC 101908]
MYLIANPDTVMHRSTAELVAKHFPVTRSLERNEALLTIEKARRELGFEPRHSWRSHPEHG